MHDFFLDSWRVGFGSGFLLFGELGADRSGGKRKARSAGKTSYARTTCKACSTS